MMIQTRLTRDKISQEAPYSKARKLATHIASLKRDSGFSSAWFKPDGSTDQQGDERWENGCKGAGVKAIYSGHSRDTL